MVSTFCHILSIFLGGEGTPPPHYFEKKFVWRPPLPIDDAVVVPLDVVRRVTHVSFRVYTVVQQPARHWSHWGKIFIITATCTNSFRIIHRYLV